MYDISATAMRLLGDFKKDIIAQISEYSSAEHMEMIDETISSAYEGIVDEFVDQCVKNEEQSKEEFLNEMKIGCVKRILTLRGMYFEELNTRNPIVFGDAFTNDCDCFELIRQALNCMNRNDVIRKAVEVEALIEQKKKAKESKGEEMK